MTEQEFFKLHHKGICGKWGHPYHSKSRGQVYEHRLEVEKVIGRYLMPEEKVHHHYHKDGSVTLVLCPNQQYHSLLHLREEALRRCGNANWRKCTFCKEYDDPKNLVIDKGSPFHRNCYRKYHAEYRRKRRA